eukprot:2248686-Rhodomonas_salina.1
MPGASPRNLPLSLSPEPLAWPLLLALAPLPTLLTPRGNNAPTCRSQPHFLPSPSCSIPARPWKKRSVSWGEDEGCAAVGAGRCLCCAPAPEDEGCA